MLTFGFIYPALLGNVMPNLFEKIASHSTQPVGLAVVRNENILLSLISWTVVLSGVCANMTINNYLNLTKTSNLFIYSNAALISIFVLLLFIYSILNYRQQKQLNRMNNSSIHLATNSGWFSELKRTDLLDPKQTEDDE